MNQAVQLQIGQSQAVLDAQNPRVLIGRDTNFCGLLADHGSVSRRHAEVYLHEGHAYIRDLGSSNGTWVNGAAVGAHPVQLTPGQQVYVGYLPLGVSWPGGAGSISMGQQVPQQLMAQMEQRQQQAASQQQAVTGGDHSGVPQHLSYRRQGSNQNGALLIALPGDTFSNEQIIDGFVEFTAMDNETIDDITVELVEVHKKGKRGGHTWDQVIVKQGPWKSARGDVLPMPFQLRVPTGTSVSSRICHWEVRGYADIKWAYDVEATSEITMRNIDVEKVRDALGLVDYRIDEIESEALGQKHRCIFQPPAQLQTQLGIRKVVVDLEYLGQNLKVQMEVDKQKRFVKDPTTDFVIELPRFRATDNREVGQHFLGTINKLMQ